MESFFATSAATVACVHRSTNERRHELDAAGPGDSLRCECECRRIECFSDFRVVAETYDDVRAHSRYFLVAPGHQSPDEAVISRTQAYVVIEMTGMSGDAAEALSGS